MRGKFKLAALAAAFTVTGGVAVAAGVVHVPNGVPKSSLNGLPSAVAADGSLKADAVGYYQIKSHSITCSKLAFTLTRFCSSHGERGGRGSVGPAGPAGPAGPVGPQGIGGLKGDKGDTGATGPQGIPGTSAAKGDKGDAGATGPQGANGAQGPQGPQGATGPQGPAGSAATVDTGQVLVYVSRNGNPATIWANYRAVLVGGNGTTGGVFRFTCSGTADCTVSVKASASTATTIYPRLLLDREEPLGGATTKSYCEYADGSTGSAPVATSTTLTTVPVNIGGTADCGGSVTTAGDVTSIDVPAGHYYDVTSTFAYGS